MQPDGGVGLWIEVTNKKSLEGFEVLFAGKPLGNIGGGEQSVTASIPSSFLRSVGSNEISIKRLKDGKMFVVGAFNVIGNNPSTQQLKK